MDCLTYRLQANNVSAVNDVYTYASRSRTLRLSCRTCGMFDLEIEVAIGGLWQFRESATFTIRFLSGYRCSMATAGFSYLRFHML